MNYFNSGQFKVRMKKMAAQVNFYLYPNAFLSSELFGAWKLAHICQIKALLTLLYLRPYNLIKAHKLTESLRRALVDLQHPLPTQRRLNVGHKTPCSECPSACAGQTGCHFATRTKKHQSAVRRQGENLLLALHGYTTGMSLSEPVPRWLEMVKQWEHGSLLSPGIQH